ncbi:MAG: ABC transporter permease [Anaerolineae bacterium]
MRNVIAVIKHEILTTVGKPSFWVMTFIFPALVLGFSLLPTLLATQAIEEVSSLDGSTSGAVLAFGCVDQAGVVGELPPGVPADRFRLFDDESAARAALAAGQIGQYFILPPDFDRTNHVIAVAERLSPVISEGGANLLRYVLNYQRTGGDARLARLLLDPAPVITARSLAPEVKADPGSAFGIGVPFVMMFVLFFVITMSSGYMLRSVSKEKESRTVELLLTSLRPRELMLGKVIGLGAVALLQMAVWLGGSVVALGSGSLFAAALTGQVLQVSFMVMAVVYFLLGYILYASALGAIGALAPTAREGSQFTFILILPLLVPFYLNQAFVNDPNSLLTIGLSLFPLSAPTAMLARMSVRAVPAWQIAVSVIGLAATTYLFVLVSARFFRADTLLSTISLSWGRIAQELRRRFSA